MWYGVESESPRSMNLAVVFATLVHRRSSSRAIQDHPYDVGLDALARRFDRPVTVDAEGLGSRRTEDDLAYSGSGEPYGRADFRRAESSPSSSRVQGDLGSRTRGCGRGDRWLVHQVSGLDRVPKPTDEQESSGHRPTGVRTRLSSGSRSIASTIHSYLPTSRNGRELFWSWLHSTSQFQALVEFALITPILLFTILGGVEAGFLLIAKADQDRTTSVIAQWAAQHPGEAWNSVANKQLPNCTVEVRESSPDLVEATSRCLYSPRVLVGFPLFSGLPISSYETAALPRKTLSPSAGPSPSPVASPS